MRIMQWLILPVILFSLGVSKAEAVIFTGTAVGEWTNVISVPGNVFSVANNDLGALATFNWGSTSCTGCTPYDNRFRFDGIGSDGDPAFSVASEDPFLIGNFEYRNGSTSQSSSIGINGIDLEVTMNLLTPLALSESFTFDFSITNTVNSTGNPVLDGDIVTVTSSFSDTTFFYDGIEYTLQLLGFSSDGGTTIRTDFSSPEGNGANPATAGVYARITSEIPPPQNTIPEPATLLLMAGGLGGLMKFRRKR